MKPKKRTTPDAHGIFGIPGAPGIFGISRILGVLGALLLLAAACQSERLTDEGGFAPGQERPLIISTTLSGVASTRVAPAATRAAAQGTTPVSLDADGKLVLTLHRSTDPEAPTQTAVYSLDPTSATPADEANPTYNLTYNHDATRDTLRARGIDPEQAQKLYVTAPGSYPLAAQGTAIKATVKQTATIVPHPTFGLGSTPLPATATLPFALHAATNGAVSIASDGTTNLPLSITSAGLMLRMKHKGIAKLGETRIDINSVRCLLTKETAPRTPSTPADDEQAGTASRVVDATFADNGNVPAHDTDGIGTSYVLFGTLPAGKTLTAGTPIAEIDATLFTSDSGDGTTEQKLFTLILPSKVTLTAGQLLTYTVHVNHSLASIEGDVTISDFAPANGDGGQQAGVGNVADGTQPLPEDFFNDQNTTWIVTGGGTSEDDALVAKNVRQALNRIYNPHKEDGSWNDDPYTGSIFIDLILLEVSTLPTRGELETGAFQKYEQLRSVSLPAAKTIGSDAFDSCTKLATVSLPAAETIGDYAFYTCEALTTASLPAAKSIGQSAFGDCTALTTANLPAATIIGQSAFANCTALTTANLPEATIIVQSAFANCTALTTANLPEATIIGDQAFANCTKLSTITLPAATDIVQRAFDNCTALTTASLPEATIIGPRAFASCTKLSTITLPKATIIREYAFQNCTKLTTATLPKATDIRMRAFDNCTALTTVSLPAAKSIGEGAFFSCTKLTTLRLTTADDITLQPNAFYGFDSYATDCTLVLNLKKKPADVDGNQWGGATWKSITYAEQ